MATMSVRSTYALDVQTAESIKRLARSWNVSQAEVVRRSVRLACEHQAEQAPSPAEVIAYYAERPLPRDRDTTRELVESMRQLRREDDASRDENILP